MISVATLRQRLSDGSELALLDVREQRDFGEGHLLAAANLPLGQMELNARTRLPRHDVPIVVCDAGEGLLAAQAARILMNRGYIDVTLLEGGVRAWSEAGLEVFSGFNVLGKAFGEWVEHHLGTPGIDPRALHEMQVKQQPHLLLDSRPRDEHLRVHVPGAIHCPGAELLLRAPGLVQSPATPIVIHCAGRTRSLIGAQLLRNAGIPNPVYALRNGTMGWELAGLKTASGGLAQLPEADREAADGLRRAADALRESCGIARLDEETFMQWQQDRSRTLYGFDIRSAGEYEAGHRSGFVNAPGGQLLQQFDEYAPVRNARIVIADDDGLRANGIATMLWQMGINDLGVILLNRETMTETGSPVGIEGCDSPQTLAISADELEAGLTNDSLLLIDLSHSSEYRRGHIDGAWFALRSELPDLLQQLPPGRGVVLTSSDGSCASWAAHAAGSLSGLFTLEGGNAGWLASGRSLVSRHAVWASEPRDVYVLPYDYEGDVAAQMQAYIDWELGLVEQLRRDGTTKFRLPPA